MGELTPGVDELMIEPLTELLMEHVQQQFWQVLSEVDKRSMTKLNAKDMASIEKDVEIQVQHLRYVLKQVEKLKKRDGMTQNEAEAVWSPVKAFTCKNQATKLLNLLITI